MLGCQPCGPFGPLDGGQMEPLRLLDKGQKGFFWALGSGPELPQRLYNVKPKHTNFYTFY